jgi:hypothetical protein
MKTLKALRAVTIWNCIFCVFWIITHICLLMNPYCSTPVFFSVAMLSLPGWMINPFPMHSCFQCLKIYWTERKNPEQKQHIGKKWVWALVWPIITTALWLCGGGMFVVMTGGA